jgi:hypothetical protein
MKGIGNMTDNTQDKPNAPAYLAEATQAGKLFADGNDKTERGMSFAIHALVQAWTGFDFTYATERKAGEFDKSVTVTLAQMNDNIVNANGSNDTKAIGARFNAMAHQLFGVKLIDMPKDKASAVAQCIRRSLAVARYLVLEDVETSIDNKGRLNVPYRLIFAAPDDKASAREKMLYEAGKDNGIPLDRRDGASISNLSKRAAEAFPTIKRASRSKKADSATSFVASVKFVAGVVQDWINPDGDTDNAPSQDVERQLYDLQMSLASYFAANPIENAGDEKIAA